MSFKNLLLCLTAAFAFAVRGEIGVSGDTTGATDTAAIQSALDAAKTGGGTVTLGGGIYYLNAALNIHDGVTLKGQGWGNTVLKPAASASIRCAELTGGATLEGVTLTGGYSANGGGAHVTDGTISWCCISNNTSTSGYGAGVSFNQGKGRIDHSIVTGNTANGAYGAGIGMKDQSGAVVIDTCLVSGNACTSTSGGGITIESIGSGRSVEICNCTVTGNSTRYNAGGVHIKNDYSGTIILRNNILSGNSAGSNLPKKPDLTLENSTADVAEYNLFGTADEAVGTGSSVGSAPFVGNGDYHLSAAKELGYTDNTGSCVDLDRKARSGALDVGCYEFGGTTPPEPQHTHVWGTPSYVWTAVTGGYTCKASAVCTGDDSHTTNLTVTASYKVTKEPTTEATGTGTYTATFAAPFATQTKDVTIAKLPKEDPPHVDPSDAAQPSGDATGAKDTKTIQDLIDAAAPSHGSVVLGSGTFLLNAQLMITNGVTLVGQGWAQTVIKAASGKNIRLATIDGNAKLEKVTLTGGKSADGAGAAVKDGTISWCCISNNVGTSGYGGGVSFSNGRGQIDHSIVADNSQSGTAYGAGIGMNNQTGSVTVDTCLIYGNACSSGSGGGVMAEHIGSGKAVMILNSTVTGNTTRYNAGGVHVKNGDNGTLVLINDILSGNTAGSNTPNNPDLTLENALATGSAYCLFGKDAEWKDVKGISNSVTGTAPFVGNGDYHLNEAMELDYETDDATSVDLDNLARSGRVDVGCYEFGGTPYVERPGLTIYVD